VLAEDSGELRQLLASGLERVGFDVIQAENGAELVEIVQGFAREDDVRGELSLIVTDVRMPGVDGIAAIQALRKFGVTAPVIFMSAFGDTRTRQEAIKLNSRWIDKPIGLNELRAVVANVLLTPHREVVS